jgi:hypothetical protein
MLTFLKFGAVKSRYTRASAVDRVIHQRRRVQQVTMNTLQRMVLPGRLN